MPEHAEQLRQQILELTRQYHAAAFPAREFVPGSSGVQVSGKVIDADDLCAVVESGLDALVYDGAVGEGVREEAGALCGRAVGFAGELGVLREPGGAVARCARRSWASGS